MPDGSIIGSFTDQAGATPADTDRHAKVYFFRVSGKKEKGNSHKATKTQ